MALEAELLCHSPRSSSMKPLRSERLKSITVLEKHSTSEGEQVDGAATRVQEEGTCVEKQLSVSLGAAGREFEAIALRDKEQ